MGLGRFFSLERFERLLTMDEEYLASVIFGNTLPFKQIRITPFLGFGQCPFMEMVDENFVPDKYILHMGPLAFPDTTSSTVKMTHDQDYVRNCFIHELTHVWQAYQGKWVFTESLYSKGCAYFTDGDAYAYEPGLEWNDYNVEQQANIVEDWFKKDKMSKGKVRYEYIRDHIRKGRIAI